MCPSLLLSTQWIRSKLLSEHMGITLTQTKGFCLEAELCEQPYFYYFLLCAYFGKTGIFLKLHSAKSH